MEVTRIKNFNLKSRPLFSGMYGPGITDDFVGPDLRRYNVWEILYLTFRSQGYHVVFYSQDPRYNFFSYRQDDLVEFFHLRGGQSSPVSGTGRYVARIDSPFGRRRMQAASDTRATSSLPPDDEGHYAQIQQQFDNRRTYFRIAHNVEPFETISHYIMGYPEKKMAFVFCTAGTDVYEHPERILPQLDTLRTLFHSSNCQAHIIALYGVDDHSTLFEDREGRLFRSSFFKEVLVGSEQEGRRPRNQLYCIAGPGRDEYRNMLNRRRLLEGYKEVLDAPGLEARAIRLSQVITPKPKDKQAYVGEVEMLNYYIKMPLSKLKETLDRLDKGRSIDQLRAMAGIGEVVRQLEAYMEALKDARDHPSSVRFRPHLVFSGNPGTGKTTVARLFADILREEGLLERGHLVEATVGDLEGEFVGQTRIKTQALCDRARGGVLFIDEAYGLMGHGGHGEQVDYGKEAIEVLMQFMENSADSLVILAGYRHDMENLIKNGNQGFMRRFNGKESFIHFEDYSKESLCEIFKKQLQGYQTDPEFDDAIHRVITHMYLHRNARWGNASEMEKLAGSILSQRRRQGSQQPISPEDIPAEKLRLINEHLDEQELLKDINALIGLDEIKHKLTQLLRSTLGRRIEARRRGEVDTEKPDLNFIFEGNPGTGKTTVARLMGKILYETGLIDDPTPAIMEKGALIKSGVGDTPKAIEQMFKDHSGKVILIDEAYSLAQHGTDAIDSIVECLTDERFRGNQALILAGYSDDINRVMGLNSGMYRRFMDNIWHFADYTNEELWEILHRLATSQDFRFDPVETCKRLAFALFDKERAKGKQFGNAGVAEAVFKAVRKAYECEVVAGASGRVLVPDYFPGQAGLLDREALFNS